MRFVVDVLLSRHGQMSRVLDWHRTIVAAEDGFEAEETAYLMAHAQGWYPVSVCIIEDPTDPIARML